jgi:hypothetical protein
VAQLFRFFLIFLNLIVLVKVLQVTHFFTVKPLYSDFNNYYQSVIDIRRGVNPYTFSYMQNLGPPLVFAYYLPFSLFSLNVAQNIFLILNIFAGYLACYLLARRFAPARWRSYFLSLSLILFGSFLSRYSLQIGQPVLTFTLLITICLTSVSPIVHSVAIAALTGIKSFFAFAFLSLLHRPLTLLIGLLTLTLILLASAFVIKPEWYVYYATRKFIPNITGSADTSRVNYENQTLKNTLIRLHIEPAYPVVWLLLFAALSYLTVRYRSLEIGLLSSMALSPVLWQHYFPALFPFFIHLFVTPHSSRSRTLGVLAFLLWWPDLRLHLAPPNLFYGLLASHFYISLLLLILAYVYSSKAKFSV